LAALRELSDDSLSRWKFADFWEFTIDSFSGRFDFAFRDILLLIGDNEFSFTIDLRLIDLSLAPRDKCVVFNILNSIEVDINRFL